MWGLSVYQWLVFNQCVVKKKMEAIKKKMAALKEEKEAAMEKKDEAEALRKEAEERADAVSSILGGGVLINYKGIYICGYVSMGGGGGP